MAVSTRTIRRRIKSVANTKKITKAMELVAAAKMRKAVAAALASRPYAEAATRAVAEIAKATDPSTHPLFGGGRRRSGKELLIIFGADRGLCGGFNSRVGAEVARAAREAGGSPDCAAVGKKAADMVRKRRLPLAAAFAGQATPGAGDIMPLAQLAMQEFLSGKYDRVRVTFTSFRSALSQDAVTRQVLPLAPAAAAPPDGGAAKAPDAPDREGGEGPDDEREAPDDAAEEEESGYLLEPSPRALLDAVLPRLVETALYQAALESSASEHSSRMLAMRSATDNAADMISSLTLTLNQARQAGITAEIAEISAGAAALSH